MTIEDIEKQTVEKKKITCGKTKDEKYLLRLKDGSTLFERVGDLSRLQDFTYMYEALKDLESLNEPGIPKPVSLGKEDDRAFLITSYSKGQALSETIDGRSPTEAMDYGEKAGRLLKAVHTLAPAIPSDLGDYDQHFKKILSNYISLSLYLPGEQNIIKFILNHMREVMTARAQTYIHGNFTLETLWKDDRDNVFFVDICDINSFDPYYDFHKSGILTRYRSLPFTKALISSYNEKDPDESFWLAFNVYSALSLLEMTIQTVKERQVKKALDHFKEVCEDFNGFDETNLVPKFYREA